MLPALLRNNTASSSALRVGPGCVAYLGRAVSLRLFSAETPQAPHEKLETISEVAVDPFLASLQQKTERDLFEILRKQQQQPASQSSDDEESKDPVTATGEHGGPRGAYSGAEPTRYGDWEKGGRCTDF